MGHGYKGTHIPPDDLHWNESEKQFVLLNDPEIDAIIMSCKKGFMSDSEACIRAVRWAEQVRADTLMLKGVIEGRLAIEVDPFDPTTCRAISLDEVKDEFGKDD